MVSKRQAGQRSLQNLLGPNASAPSSPHVHMAPPHSQEQLTPKHCFSVASGSPTEVWMPFILTYLWAPQERSRGPGIGMHN